MEKFFNLCFGLVSLLLATALFSGASPEMLRALGLLFAGTATLVVACKLDF